MRLPFVKYQGAGNDFILCDDRGGEVQRSLGTERIARLCDRHFGVGADGLMLLRGDGDDVDFEMVYYNSDGRPSTMCGNGGRCIVRYAYDLGIHRNRYRFRAVDGVHEATLEADRRVALTMGDVTQVTEVDGDYVIDTGSPHYLSFVDKLSVVDVKQRGREIRRSAPFADGGINVNFIEVRKGELSIGTYERGVEDETLACGTGVTAAVIAFIHRVQPTPLGDFRVRVLARGGELTVTGRYDGSAFRQLCLIGGADFVFSGTIDLE